MSRPFKGALCGLGPPGATELMNSLARRSCIRLLGHNGLHRNRLVEWANGVLDVATPRGRTRAKGER
jgi:hypothetical protein